MSAQRDPMEIQARFSGILAGPPTDPRSSQPLDIGYQHQPFATLPPPQSYTPTRVLAPTPGTATQHGGPGQHGTFVDPGAAYYAQAPRYNYGSVDGVSGVPRQAMPSNLGHLDMASMFPSGFTFSLFFIFITPVCLALHVGLDPHVRQWIGRYYTWVLFLPILFLMAHLIHVKERAPNKLVVISSLILPCLVILVLGDRVLLQSYDLANRFAARDCSTFPLKQDMDREFQAGKKFYANCMATMSSSGRNLTFASATALFRIQDCPGYQDLLVAHPDLNYLRQTEAQHSCAGWCDPDQPLWLFGEVKDSCSSAVAEVMFGKIQRGALQAVSYTIVVLGLSSMGLVLVGPTLRKNGLEW